MAQITYGSITVSDLTDGKNANIWTTTVAPTTPDYTFNISNLTGSDDEPREGDIILYDVYRYTISSIGATTVLAGNRQSLQGEPGTPGSPGAPGSPGTPGASVTKTETEYYRKLASGQAPQPSTTGSTTIPEYVDGCTYYTRTVTYLSVGGPVKGEWLEATTLTNQIKDAYEAWIAAGAVEQKAKSIVQDSSGVTVAAGINGAGVTPGTTSTYGYNTIMAPNYLGLRYNDINLSKLTTTGLDLYIPTMSGTTPVQGKKGLELTSNAITFYNPNTDKAQLIIGANGTLQSGNYVYTSGTYSDSGTKIDLTNGSIYTPGFRTDGSNTYIRGEINALTGKIGNNSTNYWTIGNNYNYDQTASAALISHGTAFIQLDESNTWRLSTDRIHTAWNGTDGSAALAFPKDGNTYWDWGMHSPHKTNNVWKDKFIYARKYINTTDDDFTNRDNLSNDIDDDLGFWTYQFYIDKNGSVYARNFYLLNEDGTPGSNIGGQDAVYLLKSGGTISGNLEVNGTLTKGSKNVAYLSTALTSGQVLVADGTAGGIKTSGYTIAKSVPSNAVFTDENVNTSQANTTQIYLTGTSTAGSSTGKLKFDSNVYLTTNAGTLHATTFEGNLSGTASRATADGDGNKISTSYLKLSGGNVTGAVTFGSSVSADELTAGDLVVNGAASFTNNLQANTINGVEVGASPKFTDTVTTVTVTGSGNAVTGASASNGAVTLTKGATFLTSYTETDPIFVASAAHSITSNDISNWNSKTSNTGTVTSVRVQASSPLTSTTSTASNTTLDTTIKFSNQNKNLVLAGPSSGDAAAPTFRSLVAADIPGLAWSKITSGKPTTLSGYGITDAVPSSRKVAGHALTSDVTISNSDVGLGNVINAKQITNITNEFKDGQNTGKLVIWRGESDSEVLEVQITAREATSATNATNAQYATYDASEASKTTKTTIANKYIAKSVGTKKGDIIYWSGSGTPVRLEAGTNGQVLKLANGVPTWGTDNNDNTWRAIQVNGTDILGTGTSTGKLNLKAGSNVTITNDSGTVTIASSYTNTDTKVNMKARGTTKAYLLGTTTAPTSSNQAVESVAETGVYFDTTAAKLVATTFSGALTGNASSATEFSSNATVTLTGDTTGTSAGSKKSWSIATTNSYITSLGRAASADYLTPSYLSKVHFCLASSFMTTHKPPAGDGYITTYHWDNSGWAAQFYLRHNKDNPAPMVRGATSTDNTSDWGEWKYILTEVNYTDYTVKKDGTGASGNWGINVTGTASNVTGTVAIGHGGTGLTASPSMLTNLGSTTAANVLQASPRPGVTGTLGVGNGGTGQTSAKNAANAFLNALNTGGSTPVDADYYISQYVGGGTTTTTYHRRPMSALWNYISGKISSSGTYVTIATDQTITASQKTFNGAIRWGTSSKYGAAHYDSTLEAIVFSFA